MKPNNDTIHIRLSGPARASLEGLQARMVPGVRLTQRQAIEAALRAEAQRRGLDAVGLDAPEEGSGR